MSDLQIVLGVVISLLTLAGLGGGVWVTFKGAATAARIKRLQDERDDYLSRLNFIEPRHRAVEQQNEVLLALHNPTEKLDQLGDNQTEILRVLRAQHRIIEQIDQQLYRDRPKDQR